jgi:hypothetical protein
MNVEKFAAIDINSNLRSFCRETILQKLTDRCVLDTSAAISILGNINKQ